MPDEMQGNQEVNAAGRRGSSSLRIVRTRILAATTLVLCATGCSGVDVEGALQFEGAPWGTTEFVPTTATSGEEFGLFFGVLVQRDADMLSVRIHREPAGEDVVQVVNPEEGLSVRIEEDQCETYDVSMASRLCEIWGSVELDCTVATGGSVVGRIEFRAPRRIC